MAISGSGNRKDKRWSARPLSLSAAMPWQGRTGRTQEVVAADSLAEVARALAMGWGAQAAGACSAMAGLPPPPRLRAVPPGVSKLGVDQAIGGLMASAAGALANRAVPPGRAKLAGASAGACSMGASSMAEWQMSQAVQLPWLCSCPAQSAAGVSLQG